MRSSRGTLNGDKKRGMVGKKYEINEKVGTLVERAVQGDGDAVAVLYQLYRNKMITEAHFRLGHTLHGLMESVDLVQSLWKDLLDDIGGFEYRGPDSFFRWLHTCLLNKIQTMRKYHHAEKRDPKRLASIHDFDDMDKRTRSFADPTPSQVVERKEELERLKEVLGRFPELQRQVLLLRMKDKMNYEAIGRRIGKSKEAAKKIYQRGLKKLIDSLPGEWCNDEGL